MKSRKSIIVLTIMIMMSVITYGFMAELASARIQEPAGPTAVMATLTLIDDFEDGDVSDWNFFGGNNAGGGGGPFSDRPYEGSYYFSTGWGGEGTSSSFYGGAYKNLDNAAQIALPTDPWFSVWVLNQSDATVDQFTLEITIREDLDGNGWTDGAEDSFRLDTTFLSSQFDDQWTRISAPVSSFTNLNTGGDGTFNGDLDEIVIVIGGVQGGSGSAVELDFDQFAFTSGNPNLVVIDDFEDGDVSDWNFFGGNNAGGAGGALSDRPYEGIYYLSTGWGGEGTSSSFYGGAYKNLDNAAQIASPGDPWFSVWVLNQSDATVDQFTLEITIREDLDGNGWTNGAEDSFRLDTTFLSSQFDDRWTRISAPVSSFTNLSTGGDGTFNGDLDEIVIVIGGVQGGSGATVELDFDQFAFTSGNPNPAPTVAFESGQFTVMEGGTATISAILNITSTNPITVSYETSDGTAVAGTDYEAVSGTLTFPANTLVQTFTVQTIDDDLLIGNRDVNLALSDPVGADLGAHDQATLTIEEDETTNVCELRSATVDDFEDSELPYGTDSYGLDVGFFTWTGPNASVDITTTMIATNTVLQMNSSVPTGSWGGTTHHFENDAVDTWVTQDWSTYEAISFWVYGTNSGKEIFFEVQDNRASDTTDSTEIFSYPFTDNFTGWKRFEVMFDDFNRKEIGNGAPNDGFGREDVHGWAFGSTEFAGTLHLDNIQVCGTAPAKPLTVAFEEATYSVNEGETAVLTVTLSRPYTETVSVDFATAESNAQIDHQYTPVSGTLTFAVSETVKSIEIPTFADGKHMRDRRISVNLYEDNVSLGFQRRSILTIVDANVADPRLVDDFEGYHPYISMTGTVTLSSKTIMDSEETAVPGQYPYEDVLNADFDTTSDSVSFDRIFSQGQDWTSYDGISFWYYGSNSGETITMQLKDNMTATTSMIDPGEWELVWSDEFNDPAGTPPNPNVWQHELGDGALNEIIGWGNSESQFYTNDPANASTDGNGNLVIRLQEVNTDTTDLVCWYGSCEYTSARLITQDRLDFEYGRIEARVQVPTGPAGLWPAFWMLGTDIPEVGWPQSGEIDIMEYVSRIPNEVFGTLHGPGYSGGNGFGNIYDLGEPVSNEYHTFAIEWNQDSIDWEIDGIHFHDAVPADVAPNEWVYNHPFFLILNTAIGGNFGGTIDGSMTFPQDTLVDYVRVYQAADTAERFEATFVDDFTGWQKVLLPWNTFTRSMDQPADAPDDGFTLTKIWGYGFLMPEGTTGSFMMDRVYLYNEHSLFMPLVFQN